VSSIGPDFRRYLVASAVGLSVILALFDPSPSRGLGFAGRLLFWLLHSAVGLTLFAAINGRAVRLALDKRLGAWGVTVASGITGSLAFAPAALLFERLFQVPEDLAGPTEALLESYGWPGAVLAEFVQLVLPATAVWVALNLPWLLRLDFSIDGEDVEADGRGVESPGPQADTREAVPDDDRLERFVARLPLAMGRDVVALSSELQYLRVYTTRGKALILHSLREAIELLEGVEGMQVHRSHWVAVGHVRTVVRKGRSMSLRLTNGVEIPVSRTFQPGVREIFGDKAIYGSRRERDAG
jgi:hypothetical protein